MNPVKGYAAGVAIGCGARLVNHPPSPHNCGGVPETQAIASERPSNLLFILVHPFKRTVDWNRSTAVFPSIGLQMRAGAPPKRRWI